MFRAALLEKRAAQIFNKKLYDNECFTYSQMDQNANKVANLITLFNTGSGQGRTLTEESFIIRGYPERRENYANDETSDSGTLFQNILPSEKKRTYEKHLDKLMKPVNIVVPGVK